jgi:hypothetical protein
MASGVAFFDFSCGARAPEANNNNTSNQIMSSIPEVSSNAGSDSAASSLLNSPVVGGGDETLNNIPRKKSAPRKCPAYSKSRSTVTEVSNSKSVASSLSSSFSLKDCSPSENPSWVPDEMCSSCMLCGEGFSFWLRRHHCRMCGAVACHDCSKWTLALPNLGYGTSKQRVCQPCWSVQSAVSTPNETLDWDLKKDFMFDLKN